MAKGVPTEAEELDATLAIEEDDSGVTFVRVSQLIGRNGSRGNLTQVRVEFVRAEDKRTLLRNVKGPVRAGKCRFHLLW